MPGLVNAAGGSATGVPFSSTTTVSTVVPATYRSMSARSPYVKQRTRAAGRSAARSTSDMPRVEPLVAGLTTTGRPSRSATAPTRRVGESSRNERCEIATHSGVARPALATSFFATTLSHARWHAPGLGPT